MQPPHRQEVFAEANDHEQGLVPPRPGHAAIVDNCCGPIVPPPHVRAAQNNSEPVELPPHSQVALGPITGCLQLQQALSLARAVAAEEVRGLRSFYVMLCLQTFAHPSQ
jgi:hypothetical protein